VADALLSQHEVCGLYNQAVPVDVSREISLFSNLSDVPENIDAIVLCHAAVSSGNHASSSDALFASNVKFTERVVVKYPDAKIIYLSTVGVYGKASGKLEEQDVVSPESAYALSKLWGEKIAFSNPNATIIRLSSLYGAGMKENTLIPNYVNQALKSGIVEVWGTGSRLQNYIHVHDVCELIVQVLSSWQPGNHILLGVASGENTNLRIAEIIAKITGAEIRLVHSDASASARFDNDLTRKTVNWRPHTTIEEGLRAYIEWKKKQS
ncbi:MAG: NAD(P)-dependent oxidoreductase, partial [Chitinophagaceae bacterium]